MIFIIGHARHGKDTLADYLGKHWDLNSISSSEMSNKLFIFNKLSKKYGYSNEQECFDDRYNHRKEWYDLITNYNKKDLSRLAKEISLSYDMYIGIRDENELLACFENDIVDLVVGVYDPRKPLESEESMKIDIFKYSDILIPNAGTLEEFESKIIRINNII